MTPSEAPQVAEIIEQLAEVFDREVTEMMLLGYVQALSDLSLDEIRQSVQRSLRTCKFFPKPVELIELARGRTDDLATIAWTIVDRTASFGAYRSVDFEDKAINAAIRSMGGWPHLLSLGGDEFHKWARLRFMESYEAYRRQDHVGDSGDPLIGLGEGDSATNPIHVKCLTVAREEPRLDGPSQDRLER